MHAHDTTTYYKQPQLQKQLRYSIALADLGFFHGGVTLGTRASKATEHWGGLGLQENEIWAFVS